MRTEDCREKIDSAAKACNLEEKTIAHVKRSCGISDRLKESFPEISGMATDTVLELGKKRNKGVLEKVTPKLKKIISTGKRPTKKEVKKIIQEAIQEERISNQPPTPSDVQITNCDFFEKYKNIPEGSIDCIITDPPYPGEWIENWSKLSEAAEYLLKPSGFLIAYSGELHLPEVMQRLGTKLNYYWICSLIHNGHTQLVQPRNVRAGWKPILIYQKAPFKKPETTFDDIINGSGLEKDKHPWQQAEDELKPLFETFTYPGDTVLDPFAGSGTTLAAGRKLNRKMIGYEINAGHVATIKERLANV